MKPVRSTGNTNRLFQKFKVLEATPARLTILAEMVSTCLASINPELVEVKRTKGKSATLRELVVELWPQFMVEVSDGIIAVYWNEGRTGKTNKYLQPLHNPTKGA